jgi:hypothetical protein
LNVLQQVNRFFKISGDNPGNEFSGLNKLNDYLSIVFKINLLVMKAKNLFPGILATIFIVLVCCLCTPKSENVVKIENTLKSVSLFYDSVGVNPSDLMSFVEHMNKAIDSIGYPNAGYKLWIVQSDTSKDYRFMLEGYWPDQATYDLIHNHELYKNAGTGDEGKIWKNLKSVSYNRFVIVK